MAGEVCDKTCDGTKPDIDPTKDPDYRSFKDMVSFSNTKTLSPTSYLNESTTCASMILPTWILLCSVYTYHSFSLTQYSCIEDKCVIQLGACNADDVCKKCCKCEIIIIRSFIGDIDDSVIENFTPRIRCCICACACILICALCCIY